MGAVRRSPDPRRGGLSRGGRRRGRAHALRARHGPRPPRVPPPLPLGPADRSGDPSQAVAAAAPQARAVRGARLGGVRAADRLRPRSGDPAPDRAPPRAAWLAGRSPAELDACGLAPKRSIALVRVAREVASGRTDLTQHEPAWRRLRAIPNIGSWTLEMLAVAGQGRDDQLPAL